jgi:hypothetical protein
VIASVVSWLRYSAAAALTALMFMTGSAVREALAADQCGAGVAIICANDGTPGTDINPYAGGISYGNADQTLSLATGVVVTSTANTAVELTGGGTQALNIASGVQVTAQGGGVDAVSIYNSASTTIRAAGSTVRAQGTFGWGFGLSSSGAIDLIAGDIFAGTSPTTSQAGRGVSAESDVGPISIKTGNVTVQGNNFALVGIMGVYGFAHGTEANAAVNIDTTGGTVALTGTNTATGVRAMSGGGPITIKTGAVTNTGNTDVPTG